MMLPPFMILFYLISILIISSHGQIEPSYQVNNPQLDCISNSGSTTLGYTCDESENSCPAYLIFRSQTNNQTPSQIASLLNSSPSSISQVNSIPENSSIPIGDLVIIPTTCSCVSNYSQHNTSYTIQSIGETYFLIANDTYQGLSTCQAITAQNPYDTRELAVGMKIQVPLRCACPTSDQITQFGVKFLVTYFVLRGDDVRSIAQKLNSDYQSVLSTNRLSSDEAIHPFTTILLPINNEPSEAQIQSLQPPPPPPPPSPASSGSTKKWVYAGIGIGAGVLILCGCLSWFFCCFRSQVSGENPIKQVVRGYFKDQSNKGASGNDIDLPLFDFATIAVATNYFSAANKLGVGGFGPVYQGKLGEDEDIAVKRLSKTSQQGVHEFKNEVMLIAKLQHRNLVRLLGCCIQQEERMLIYEFMRNKSLDTFLFGKGESSLDWNTRYQIIVGITHGLLYLHHDSRLRIIHRDLKASNILLDKDMNPKISDFGMARIFGGDETDFNTRTIVGTYGYMSPEYALEGIFSMKSDVFSFGVLVLEIISGKRNRGVYAFSPHLNLVAHAWNLWNEGQSLQLVDESIDRSFSTTEVIKCIKIGLLCVQERPEDRPLMLSVIQMLGSDVASLTEPKQPGFVARIGPVETNPCTSNQGSCTSNDMTLTALDGR